LSKFHSVEVQDREEEERGVKKYMETFTLKDEILACFMGENIARNIL